MSMDTSHECHEGFQQRLEDSQPAVRAVADYLARAGYVARVNPHTVAPTMDQAMLHGDAGDLTVEMTVEVKHRQFDFTGPDDYPYDTVLVDNRAGYEAKYPRPLMHIILNKAMTHAIIVHRSTYVHWQVKRRYIKTDRRHRDVLLVDVELCKFAKL